MKTQLFTMMMICFFYGATAQVGVNTTTPEQTLDVNGKVRVGDDANDATAGTMRFNNSNNDFEGYNGTSWNSLTQSAANSNSLGPLPEGAIPVVGRILVLTGSGFSKASFRTYGSQGGTSFQTVPDGKTLIVTSLLIGGRPYEYNIALGEPIESTQGLLNLSIVEFKTHGPSETQHLSDPFGLLTTIPSGLYFAGINYGSNNVTVGIRGFLVDNSFTY